MDNKEITIRCNCGKEISVNLLNEGLDWEIVEADEREMGTESLFETEFDVECEECHQDLTVTLQVWEYPEGFVNMEEILIEGGELVKKCEIGDLIIDNEE